MCIRDRDSRAEITRNAFLEKLKKDYGVQVKKENIKPIYACLLYTSDAADERSSVDLGGRRIIKKKKLTMQTWQRDVKKNRTKRHELA